MQEEEGAPPLGFDEITVERESGGGGGCGGGSPAGNRWPRQETTALLKIRSDMDPLFQEATLKAPLWELISRKLREEGFQRSAKKCKEKFENVFKYYKRTKEARAGKSYRFFSQLEAFRTSAAAAVLPPSIMSGSDTMVNFEPTSSGAAAAAAAQPEHTLFSITDPPPPPPPPAAVAHITTPAIAPPPTDGPSSSSNPSSYSGTESENESRRKRKRKLHSGGEAPAEGAKMMAFFEGLIQKVIDQQEKMLQKFLEAIERREQNRMIREEAWRRQEKSRLSKEHELAAEERAAAASRDDAIVSFLQKLTGQKIPFPPPPPSPTAAGEEETPTPTPPPPENHPVPPPKVTPLSSSRWPKPEVHALIKLRSGMELRYQESIPKGPLWEEISSGMLCLGYNRSAKRCKEKWENINKYFKKVKESTKSRRDDAKTCPYFHQLDALYRNKLTGGDGGSGGGSSAAAEDRLSSVLAVKKKTL